MDDIMLYCHNDACTFRSSRYIVTDDTPSAIRCPSCHAKLEDHPVRREANARGPRSYNSY